MQAEFEALNTRLVGLSIDGLYSHIAWLRTIKEKIEFNGMKNIEVTFPLIEDITMNVEKKYGMIQPGESRWKRKMLRLVFLHQETILRAGEKPASNALKLAQPRSNMSLKVSLKWNSNPVS